MRQRRNTYSVSKKNLKCVKDLRNCHNYSNKKYFKTPMSEKKRALYKRIQYLLIALLKLYACLRPAYLRATARALQLKEQCVLCETLYIHNFTLNFDYTG